jgi:hypothetical protein
MKHAVRASEAAVMAPPGATDANRTPDAAPRQG